MDIHMIYTNEYPCTFLISFNKGVIIIFYLNKAITIEVNSEIIEYDMKSGNTSVIRHFGLLPNEKVSRLEKMPKGKRVKEIGMIMKNDASFSKNLEKGFNELVKQFIELNRLDRDSDIISIKRDAVFVLNKPVSVIDIGEHVHFIPKNSYTAYLYCNPYEFYFIPVDNDYHIDIKGLSEENLKLHESGMLCFFKDLIDVCSDSNMKRIQINQYMKDFVELYKKRKLDSNFYREFNDKSSFKVRFGDQILLLNDIDKEIMDDIDISYNYINIILPLIRNLC